MFQFCDVVYMLNTPGLETHLKAINITALELLRPVLYTVDMEPLLLAMPKLRVRTHASDYGCKKPTKLVFHCRQSIHGSAFVTTVAPYS